MRSTLLALLRRGHSDESERGSIVILVALASIALIGMGALALDVGYAYDIRNRLSGTADSAAKAAAYEVWRGNSANYAAFAQRVVNEDVAAGRIPSGVTPIIRLCSDAGATCAGAFSSNKYVEVILSRAQGTFLASVTGRASLTPTARAVAGYVSGSNCMVILGGQLLLENNVDLSMSGCGVAAGGTLSMGNGSSITASSVAVTSGACNAAAQNCTNNAPYPADPLASLPAPSPAPSHTCSLPVAINSNTTIRNTLDVDLYHCGMTIDTATVTFQPGIYYIAGPVKARNGGAKPNLQGSGVMFYLAPGASWQITSNHVTMNLSAPTSGTYSGVLFYQDRTNSVSATLSKNGNGGDVFLSGAMYFPSADVTMKNHNDVGLINDCTLVVAKSLTMGNGSTMSNTCSAYSGSPVTSIALAE